MGNVDQVRVFALLLITGNPFFTYPGDKKMAAKSLVEYSHHRERLFPSSKRTLRQRHGKTNRMQKAFYNTRKINKEIWGWTVSPRVKRVEGKIKKNRNNPRSGLKKINVSRTCRKKGKSIGRTSNKLGGQFWELKYTYIVPIGGGHRFSGIKGKGEVSGYERLRVDKTTGTASRVRTVNKILCTRTKRKTLEVAGPPG